MKTYTCFCADLEHNYHNIYQSEICLKNVEKNEMHILYPLHFFCKS
jgi:hypothetical protein